MIISIHNNQMEVVDFMSNDIPGTLKYHDEEITAYLANGCISNFNLTVDKFQNGKLHPRLKYLNDQSYLSFVDDLGDTHLYTIRKIIERDYTMEIEAEDASLEMLNETIGKYEASTEMTFIEYCSSMELLKYTRVEIGLNEISSKKVKATFDATQTVLERFFELVSAFNAECEFKTLLYPNGQLKYIQLNVYEPYSTSEPFKGVGDDRKDIQLHFGREVQGVTITTDKENLFNAIRLKDKDGNYVTAKKNHIWLGSDNLREAYMMRNTHTMYAPKSMMQYPSVSNVNSCDNWSLREFSTELTDYDEQIKYMHAMLKTYMYPIITYEVDMSYFHVFSNYKVRLGDTIYISDPNFLNGLLFQARVSEYKKNPSDTTQNTITLTNAVRITPKINEAMKQRMEELAAMMAPYTMTLKTDNGITFKDMSSESTIIPSLFKGTDECANVDFMYFQNETFLGEGDTYTVRASSMGGGTQTIIAKAYVSGELVMSQQITFAHVLGIANTVVTYGLSMSDTTEPATWSSDMPALVKGMYLWTRTVLIYTNGSSTTSYQISYIATDADATAAIDKTKQELLEKLETVRDDSLEAVDEAKQGLINVNTKVDNAKVEITQTKQQLTTVADDLSKAKTDFQNAVSAVEGKIPTDIGTVNLVKGTGSAFVMGGGITNTTWDETKKQSILDFSTPGVNLAFYSEILPQGDKFWDFKPIKGTTYTQSIMIDTDATFNPNGQAKCTWYANAQHNHQKAYIKKVGAYSYQVWSTYTWNLENIELRAFDWLDLHNILLFRTTGTYLAFYKPKLTTGNLPSDWSPAPEDTATQISSLSSELKQTADGMTLLATKTELEQARETIAKLESRLANLESQLATASDLKEGDE